VNHDAFRCTCSFSLARLAIRPATLRSKCRNSARSAGTPAVSDVLDDPRCLLGYLERPGSRHSRLVRWVHLPSRRILACFRLAVLGTILRELAVLDVSAPVTAHRV
jgi:hypothetical protein